MRLKNVRANSRVDRSDCMDYYAEQCGVEESSHSGEAYDISRAIDSRTHITGWTRNQGNKRKLKDFVVRNAKKYEQSS